MHYSRQRELVKLQKEKELTTVYGEPSPFAIVRGYNSILEELGPLSKSSVRISSRMVGSFEELGINFYIQEGEYRPRGAKVFFSRDFLDVGLEDFIQKDTKSRWFVSVPEQGTYYLLALGLIDLDRVHGVYISKEETGLPFSFFLSKKENAFDSFRGETFSLHYSLAVYGLIKQLYDEDFLELLRSATTNAELLHHRLYTEGGYKLEEHSSLKEVESKSEKVELLLSRKVITPTFKIVDIFFQNGRRIDLFDYTKLGLRPAYAHLLYLAYFGKDEDKDYGKEALKTSILM